MGTTQADILRWLEKGKANGATHVLVICDTYDYEDFPKFVMPDEDVREVYRANHGPNMQKVMEVYSLTGKHTIEEQLREHRAFNYD